MKEFVNPDGIIVTAVPGQPDKWGIEDEISGHFRRYSRNDIIKLYEKAGLTNIKVWSVSVPVANFLYKFSNLTIKKSEAIKKKTLTLEEQTKVSGFRDVPFKNIFPPFFKIFLNKFTMYPFCILQKMFYNTNYGMTILGSGKVI
jgi:hypothetical protein